MSLNGAGMNHTGRGTQSLTHLPIPGSSGSDNVEKRATSFDHPRRPPNVDSGKGTSRVHRRKKQHIRYSDYNAPLGGYNSEESDDGDDGRRKPDVDQYRRHHIRRKLYRKHKANKMPGQLSWIKWMNSDAKNREYAYAVTSYRSNDQQTL